MPIHIPAAATCDHCGKTAPCKLECEMMGEVAVGSRSFKNLAIDVHNLGGWFSWRYLMACSVDCKEALSKDPPYASFGGAWTPIQ